MSAIILTPPPAPRPPMKRKITTPALSERTPLLPPTSSSEGGRTRPLRDTLSTARFIVICAGIFSANFAFAFQSTSVPTLMTGISSGFGHAELGSYLGSVFTLMNTAGESEAFSPRTRASEIGRGRGLVRKADKLKEPTVIPVYGVLMESLGRKTAMLTAGLFYGIGTILCATSGSMYHLIAARAVSGVRRLPSSVLLTRRSAHQLTRHSSAAGGC